MMSPRLIVLTLVSFISLALLSLPILRLLDTRSLNESNVQTKDIQFEHSQKDPAPSNNALGEPFVFTLDAGQKDYFAVVGIPQQGPADEYLNLVATPFTGDCDLYASHVIHQPNKDSCDQNPHHCANSTTAHGDIISLKRGEEEWSGTTLYIGVDCRTNAKYMLNVYLSDQGFIKLTNGQPQVSIINQPRTYLKYQFTMPDDLDLIVSVTPTVGDPDLYIKWGADADKDHNDWSSATAAGDIIRINKDDPKYHPDGVYHISVFGYSHTIYTIAMATVSQYVELMEAIPIESSVKQDEYRYFKYESKVTGIRLMFLVNPSTLGGDPDIYVTRNVDVGPPGPDNAQWRSASVGDDEVIIDSCETGFYYIGVRGFSESDFTILPITEYNNIQLSDGNALDFGIEPQQTHLFKFYHIDEQSGLSIQVSNDNIYGFALDVFVSTTDSHPDEDKNDYVGTKIGASTVLQLDVPIPVGTYYIAVRSQDDVHTNYTITASSTQAVTTIFDGTVSLGNTVPKDHYRFFQLNLANIGTNDIHFVANPYEGDVDLFVSTSVRKPKKHSCTDTSCWTSETYDSDFITVDHTDPKITGNTFYIGVNGVFARNSFTILAYTSGQLVLIRDGDTLPSVVKVNSYSYFKLPIATIGRVRIDMVLDDNTNDADMYATDKTEYPNKVYCEDTHNCMKSVHFGNDFIEFENTYENTYYIGVYGYSAPSGTDVMSFKISVRSVYHRVTSNSKGILESTPAGKMQSLVTNIKSYRDTVVITTTLISGMTTLYAYPNTSKSAGPDNHFWKSDLWPGNALIIRNNDPGWQAGDWSLGVFAHQDSDYVVSVSNGDNHNYASMMELGRPMTFIAPMQANNDDSYFYLKFVVCASCTPGEQSPEDYFVNIREISAETDVYISQTDIPTKDTNQWKLEGVTASLTISKSELKAGTVLMAVKSATSGRDSTFIITVRAASQPTYMTTDQSQSISFGSSTSQFFRVLNPSSTQKLTFGVESCGKDVPPVAYGSKTNKHPDENSNDYKSQQVGTYTQKIDIPTISFNDSPETYFAAYGNEKLDNSVMEFYTYRTDPTPVVSTTDITGSPGEDGKCKITFHEADNNPRFPSSQFLYAVFVKEIDDSQGPPEAFNMETSCSLVRHSSAEGIIPGDMFVDKKYTFKAENVDNEKTYMTNIMVIDMDRGFRSSYKPMWINAGHIMDHYEVTCYGKLSSDTKNVCGGNGKCTAKNKCECSKSGYGGEQCQIPICDGVLASDSKVCSGHGKCVSPNFCECSSKYSGWNCASLKTSPGKIVGIVIGVLLGSACIIAVLVALLILVPTSLYLIVKRLRKRAYASVEEEEDNMDYLDKDKSVYNEL